LDLFLQMPEIETFIGGKNINEIYNEVLIDTPLGPYIQNCLEIDDLNDFCMVRL